ncbi:hypothetical protein QYM36_019593 [Artemia franciscana]|uniref:DUF2789 domain-containing protein n=1 Tax=Artemia franciscana TaxID=6661 RepID=A0AA88H117_ARTSF|nr:hypothetical protein QYM36_019593 [Artemia franciscana]
MDLSNHDLPSLFKQLGLPHDDVSVDTFILRHKDMNRVSPLHEANFWSESQSAFLKEAHERDADWAEVVDQLDAMLRG